MERKISGASDSTTPPSSPPNSSIFRRASPSAISALSSSARRPSAADVRGEIVVSNGGGDAPLRPPPQRGESGRFGIAAQALAASSKRSTLYLYDSSSGSLPGVGSYQAPSPLAEAAAESHSQSSSSSSASEPRFQPPEVMPVKPLPIASILTPHPQQEEIVTEIAGIPHKVSFLKFLLCLMSRH
jgi:hypothetical protein